ncbi:MAG: single-stranded DNA-binding protein [Actinomycetaceae bacterium]|nr:single-stranded DNA-binding protein [Actinomycetaceae bacterium]
MAGETVITVVGNLTADPELRFSNAGVPYASFTIASTPRSYNRQSGKWEDGEALFLRASIWNEAAENVADSLKKGMRVIAQGRLTQRSWETQQGERRTAIDLRVDEIGPSLKWASAKVERAPRGGGYGNGGGYDSGAPAQGGGRGGYGQGNFNAPSGGPHEDPWATGGAQGGSSFDDEPPF